MKPLCYLNSAKFKSRSMIAAFAAGSGAEITTKLEFVPGREAVFWGVDPETLPLWNRVVETGTPYIYVDNGYFLSRWTGGDYYRITRNAEQCTGEGESDGSRWKALRIGIEPWRRNGRHILLAVQSDFWHQRHGHGGAAAFKDKVCAEIRLKTSRPVIVRGKPIYGHIEPPLEEHFKDCWAIVTHSSMVAARALLAGIPAFALAPGCMRSVTSSDLAQLDTPFYPEDRLRWASVLADNQWRLNEIENGTAWAALNPQAATPALRVQA